MLSYFLTALLLVGFVVLATFWAYAEASSSDKTPREIAKLKATARVNSVLAWLVFGVLAAFLPYMLWVRLVIIGGGAFIALIAATIVRGKAHVSATGLGKKARAFKRVAALPTVPLMPIISVLSNFLLRKMGVDPETLYAGVSEEEILRLVKVGGEVGSIDTTEQEMIDNVFAFDDTSVQDVCTHRTDIEAIEATATRDEIIKIIIDTKFSRYPVYEEHIDNIIGVVHIKDILKHIITRNDILADFSLREHVTEPYFAPQSMKIDELFRELNVANAAHLAIVVDEYGGTYGLVTVEDLVESIVGQIYDETDDVEVPDFQQLGEGRYIILGGADLAETAEILGIDIEIGEFETIGGYLVHLLERIPADGEKPSISHLGYNFYVREVKEKRIHSVYAEKKIENEELHL